MLITTKKWVFFVIFVIGLAACSTTAVMDKNERAGTNEKSKSIFAREPSDSELFEDAIAHLRNSKNQPNDHEIRVKLENLITQHPQSKWVESARALIDSLERISDLQEQLRQEKQKSLGSQAKLNREIEILKETAEKYSTEINRLQQENEQLKNDIQQLKNLEIQLEKRKK